MKIPFTIQQFLEVFKQYNHAVFPMQVIFYLLAGLLIYLGISNDRYASVKINLILSFFWLWMGVVYHLLYFTAINKAAYIFGALIIFQGILFYYKGFIANKLSYHFRPDVCGIAGAMLMLYALVGYPLLSYWLGHVYPAAPTFGLPCPTTIFTFGVLLWFDRKLPLSIVAIPLLWSVIGFFAAISLQMREDTGLLVAAVVSIILIVVYNHKKKEPVDAGFTERSVYSLALALHS